VHDVSPPTRSLLSYGSLSEIVGASAVWSKSMTSREHPSFTLGIEEEYFLVNPWTHAHGASPIRFHIDRYRLVQGATNPICR
jgi:hypothetical protein